MKDNYNIKINPPELSSDAIQQHQDFDALFAQFEQMAPTVGDTTTEDPTTTAPQPLKAVKGGASTGTGVGSFRMIAFMAAASVALFFGVRQFFTPPTDTFNSNSAYAAFMPLELKQPLPQLEKPFATFGVSAEKGDTLVHASGSKVIVPASAFVNKDGQPIKGKVDIEYRELEDHVDQFIAGVPQKIKKQKGLQSAGMLQIQGYQNGEPVFIQEGKTLEVELKAKVPASVGLDELEVHAYAAAQDDWIYKGQDQVKVLTESAPVNDSNNDPTPTDTPQEIIAWESQQTAKRSELERSLELPKKPLEPKKIDPNAQMFEIEFDRNELPEFKEYGQVVWEVIDGQIIPDNIGGNWASDVEHLDENTYQITFSNSDGQRLSYKVVPVISDPNSYRKMKENYAKKTKAYEEALAARENEIELAMQEWLVQNPKPAVTQQNPIVNTMDTAAIMNSLVKEVLHSFEIDQFGLWNCGKKIDIEPKDLWVAEFTDEVGKRLEVAQVFVTNQQQQMYYEADPNQRPSLAVTYQKGDVLWALTDDKVLYVAQKEPRGNVKYTFELTSVDGITTEEDLRSALAKNTISLDDALLN